MTCVRTCIISCICNRFTYLKLEFLYIGIIVVSDSSARFIDFDIDGIVATVWFFLLPLESLITTFNNCDGIMPSSVLCSVLLTLDVITITIRIVEKNAVKRGEEFITISNLCGRIRLRTAEGHVVERIRIFKFLLRQQIL